MHFYVIPFSENQDRKYYVSRISKQWVDGLALCLQYDMDYVTLESSSEANHFLSLLVRDVYYVGITDSLSEGTFYNYETVSFANTRPLLKWGPGEPNNAGSNEDCVYMGMNSVSDVSCLRHVNVACQRRLPVKPATKIVQTLAPEPAIEKFKRIGG